MQHSALQVFLWASYSVLRPRSAFSSGPPASTGTLGVGMVWWELRRSIVHEAKGLRHARGVREQIHQGCHAVRGPSSPMQPSPSHSVCGRRSRRWPEAVSVALQKDVKSK